MWIKDNRNGTCLSPEGEKPTVEVAGLEVLLKVNGYCVGFSPVEVCKITEIAKDKGLIRLDV